MVKIMLVCSAGMSTSLLVNKMKEVAAKRGLEAEIWATSEVNSGAEFIRNPADVILVGPQVRYLLNAIKERTNQRCQMQFMPKKYWKDLIEMQ